MVFVMTAARKIGIRGLKARPTAVKCIDCKTFFEGRNKRTASHGRITGLINSLFLHQIAVPASHARHAHEQVKPADLIYRFRNRYKRLCAAAAKDNLTFMF